MTDGKLRNAEGRLGLPRAAFAALLRERGWPQGRGSALHFMFTRRAACDFVSVAFCVRCAFERAKHASERRLQDDAESMRFS
jgi:hypothetical protein